MMISQYTSKVNFSKVRGKDSRRLVYHHLGLKRNLSSNPAAGTLSVVKKRLRCKAAIASEHHQEQDLLLVVG